jgi:hypothetical protein
MPSTCDRVDVLGPAAPTPFDPSVLWRYADLRARGVDPQRAPGWQRVRRGVWLEARHWRSMTPGERHAALVHATSLLCDPEGRTVFAVESAAALWGLPRVEPWPESVRTLVTGARRRGSPGIRPQLGAEAVPVVVAGLRATSVSRTVVDLARTGSLASAVGAGDHALRHGLCTRDQLVQEADAVPPRSRRRPVARLVAELADPGAMSVGESLSRVQMFLLGLPRPRLQVEHTDDAGRIGFVDFDWDGVVGEFDGRVKYRVPEGADPREAAEVVWREKRREDRLRARSRMARWTWAVALEKDRLARVLDAQGVRPAPRSSWFDLGSIRSA